MITDSHEGDLTVDDDVTITGMVIGIVRVTEHGSLDLRGTVSGGVHVAQGGTAMIRGTVQGDVIAALGSHVEVIGVVQGQVRGQDVVVHPDAVVSRRR